MRKNCDYREYPGAPKLCFEPGEKVTDEYWVCREHRLQEWNAATRDREKWEEAVREGLANPIQISE